MQVISNATKISRARRARALVAATATAIGLVNLVTPGGAKAATFTWANNGTQFNTGANWVGGAAPSSATTLHLLTFQGTPAAGYQPNLTAAHSVAAFDIQTSGWVFSGSRMQLGNGSATSGNLSGINTTTNVPGTLTFNNIVALGSSPVNFNTTLDVTFNAAFETQRTDTATARTMNIGGPGVINVLGGMNLNVGALTQVGTFSVVGTSTAGVGTLGTRTMIVNSVVADGGAQPGRFRIDADDNVNLTVQFLNNNNTYSGGTWIAGGNLQIAGDGALGTGGIVVRESGTISLMPAAAAVNNTHAINYSGTGTRTLTLDTTDAANTWTISQNMTSEGGASSLTKIGAGTLILSGDNSALVGTTAFNGGHLVASHANALGSSTSTVRMGGGTLSSTIPLTLANPVTMNALSTIAGDQPITFNGVLQHVGTTARAESFRATAATTIAGGMVITNATSGPLQFTITGDGIVDIPSVVSEAPGNAGNLRIINTGTVTLGAANTYTGGSVIGDTDADINLGNDQAFGIGGTVHWLEGTIRSTSAGLRTIANPVSLEPASTGSLRLAGGDSDWAFTGPMTVTGGTQRQLAIGSGITATISGVISDSGDGTGFAKAGAGTLVLTNNNTYAGGTALRNGTTVISNDNNLGAAAGGLEFDGGILRPTAAITSNRPMSINTGGGTYNTNGFNSSNAGDMSGTGVFNKDGGGQLSVKHLRAGGIGANDGVLRVSPNGTPANVSQVGTISVGAAGIIDMTDNDMIVSGMTKAAVQTLLATGYNLGGYDGLGGVTTSSGLNAGNTTLGMLDASEYANNVGVPDFDGVLVQPNDVLIKYTYFGDVDFNGQIDASDYNLIDFGFVNGLGGWANGDADYSGGVDASDYNVIDFAFTSQNGVVLRAISFLDGTDRSMSGMSDPSLQKVAEHLDQFGESYANGFLAAVPEPTSIGVIGLAAGALMTRRRRRVMK